MGSLTSADRGRARAEFLLVSWLVAAPASAATYYVDATAGNDANIGTSPTAAWRSAPGMSAYSGVGRLAPGDTVYFDRADVWLVTGTQGIHLVGGVTYVGNQWGAGTGRAVLRAGADLAAAVVRFRDHATLATNFRGFEVDANGKVANGIEMNHSFYLGPLTGATKRIDDVLVHRVWSRTSLGQFKYGIMLSNHGGADGEVANVEILNSTVRDISRDGIGIYPGDQNAQCIVRNVLVRNTVIHDTGQDPDYGAGAGIVVKGHVVDAVLEYNHVSRTKGAGIFVNGNETNHFNVGPRNIHLRYNIVAVDTSHGSIRIYDGASGKDPKDVSIYGNLVFGNTRGSGLAIDSDLGNTNAIRVYNNTFVDAPVVVNNTLATFSVLEFRNNVFRHATAVPFSDNGRTTAHGHNLYSSGGATLVRAAGRVYDAAGLASYEPSGIAADPRFASAADLPVRFVPSTRGGLEPSPAGLYPAPGSPAVDRGAPLPSGYAGSANSVNRPYGAAWDIGAYEYAGGASRPSAPTNLNATP